MSEFLLIILNTSVGVDESNSFANRNALFWLFSVSLTWLFIYNISKIVRALLLAESRVVMRVCKHGLWRQDVLPFLLWANHASTNLKKVLSWKTCPSLLDLPISLAAETWRILRNMQCHFVVVVFALELVYQTAGYAGPGRRSISTNFNVCTAKIGW